MKGSSFIAELKYIFTNRRVLIPIIAVIFIPVLYAGMFLWAFWDPYAKMADLPVAVVNQDTGAEFEGKDLKLGKELVDKLEESEKFKFDVVSKEKGYKGLNNQKYYMLVEIPADFSKNATTLLDDQPEKLEIKYVPNEGMNFLSGQIGETAMREIKAEISKNITATYAETMFAKVTDMADGLAQASDGASQIHDGAVQLADGSKEIKTNLELLASKSIVFHQGVQKAAKGVNDLATGTDQVKSGLGEINEKLPTLISGSEKIQAGQEALKQQLPKQIADGITEQLKGSVNSLNTGVDNFEEKLGAQLSAGLTEQIASSMAKDLAAEKIDQIAKLPDAVVAQLYPERPTQEALEAQLKAQLVEKLQPGINQGVKGGLDQGFSQFKTDLDEQLLGVTTNLEDQLKAQTDPAFNELTAGMNDLKAGQIELQKGVNQLFTGSSALDKGAQDLTAGMNQLSDGAGQIEAGAGKLADGSKQLKEGTTKLVEGSTELSNKLADGAKEANSVQANDETYEMMGEPVTVNKQEINKVPNYGTGFAPYFISLGLFVGALLISIVFVLKEPVVRPKSALRWFLSKFGVIAIVGIIQSLLVDFIVLAGLKIEVSSVPLFLLTTLITSIVFMTLIQMLVTMMGDPGRFIGIIVLILQLTTSAGTFPLELIPTALQPINALLPMTYSIQAFKAAITSGDFAYMWHNNGILIVYMISFMLITLGYFKINMKRQMYGANPTEKEA